LHIDHCTKKLCLFLQVNQATIKASYFLQLFSRSPAKKPPSWHMWCDIQIYLTESFVFRHWKLIQLVFGKSNNFCMYVIICEK
jgi:hypothetical protein